MQRRRARARRVAGAARRRAAGGRRCRDRPRRRHAPRRGRAARLATPRAALARAACSTAARPLLGVCLGSQLVARAAGAEVFRSAESEVGWLPVELHRGRRDGRPGRGRVARAVRRLPVAPLHPQLPAGAVELARSAVCTQALPARERVGRPVPPGGPGGAGRGVARRGAGRRGRPGALLARRPGRASTGWNELGRRLCSAFLAAA